VRGKWWWPAARFLKNGNTEIIAAALCGDTGKGAVSSYLDCMPCRPYLRSIVSGVVRKHPLRRCSGGKAWGRGRALAVLLGLGHVGSARAQAPADLSLAAAPVPRAVDTVRAVHLLFQDRRTGGLTFAFIGLPLTGIFTLFSVGYSPGTGTTSQPHKEETLLEGAFVGALPLGAGISKLARFSKAKEAALIAAYKRGGPLPATIRARLTRKYFL